MSSNESDSLTIRSATLADAELIVKHRRAMFFDMGYCDSNQLDEISAAFLPWLRRKMEAGEYLHWFAVAADGSVAAGAGVWLMDWPANIVHTTPWRGNILNVYTEAAYRRRGLARQLMQVVLNWCRAEGVMVVSLHASAEGRLLYDSLGFQPTNEMRIKL